MVLLTRSSDQVEFLENCGVYFKLRIPKDDISVGRLFGQLHYNRAKLGIDYFSVTQTTLEQIF